MKFSHYRMLESLQDYVLIAQNAAYVERFLRQADGTWNFQEAKRLDASRTLTSIDCTLVLKNVYRRVVFEGEQMPPSVID